MSKSVHLTLRCVVALPVTGEIVVCVVRRDPNVGSTESSRREGLSSSWIGASTRGLTFNKSYIRSLGNIGKNFRYFTIKSFDSFLLPGRKSTWVCHVIPNLICLGRRDSQYFPGQSSGLRQGMHETNCIRVHSPEEPHKDRDPVGDVATKTEVR